MLEFPTHRPHLAATLLLTALLAACGPAREGDPAEVDAAPPEAPPSAAALPESLGQAATEALQDFQVFEPQLLIEGDGTIVLFWRQKQETGFDLFSAHLGDDGAFSTPFRVNDEPGTIYSYPHDEMRPGVATNASGQLAVAWTDERGQIRAARGSEHGRVWEPSVKLDQADTPAYRSFTAVGIDAAGAMHAIWIDSRHAPQVGAEEPADLFYARVDGDHVEEVNLTADQEASICGCCKPDLVTSADGTIQAVFRNTTDDGYRDIFTIDGHFEKGFAAPRRVGPPTWKLQGCPMSGPLGLGDEVLWREAATKEWVVRRGQPGSEAAEPVFVEGTEDWASSGSPRMIAGTRNTVLIPGRPGARVIQRSAGSWMLLREDLPAWATSAAAIDGGILAIGATDGKIESVFLPDSL